MSEKIQFWLLFICLFIVASLFAAINLHPPWREAVRSTLLTEKREILAKAQGALTTSSREYIVLKIQTREALFIEVYELDHATGSTLFQTKVKLPEKRDGYFSYQGNVTNFLLADVDSDGALEIIAPCFDENLTPRVHVYKYHIESNSLELLGPDTLKL